MWISRNVYEQDRLERGIAETRVQDLRHHNIALQTMLDWMRVRLTQLEYERAQLIHNYMGVKIAVPSFEPAPDSANTADQLNQTLSFQDIGDKAAAAMGLSWNEQGQVTDSEGRVLSYTT